MKFKKHHKDLHSYIGILLVQFHQQLNKCLGSLLLLQIKVKKFYKDLHSYLLGTFELLLRLRRCCLFLMKLEKLYQKYFYSFTSTVLTCSRGWKSSVTSTSPSVF